MSSVILAIPKFATKIFQGNFKEILSTSFVDFFAINGFSFMTIQREKRVINNPWPRSPNMTANRKGNVIIVKGVGLASLYAATP